MVEKFLRIKLVKSPIGRKKDQKATVRALGLRHLQDEVVKKDTPVIRGMVNKVAHLLQVEEVSGEG